MSLEYIGILLTVLFGVPSYLALRKEKKTKLFFIEEEKINLYDKVVKSFEDLEIAYKKKSIRENMFLLKGFLFCIGKKDILKEDIHKSVSFNLSNNGIWHECKIIGKSDGLDANLLNKENKVELPVALIKNYDFYYLEFLGESDNNEYNINHRIANVPKVKETNFTNFKNLWGSFFTWLILISIGTILLISYKPYKLNDYNLGQTEVCGITQDSSYYSTLFLDYNINKKFKIDSLLKLYNDSVYRKYNVFNFLIDGEKIISTNNGLKFKYALADTFASRVFIIVIILLAIMFMQSFILSIIHLVRYRKMYELLKKEIAKGNKQIHPETKFAKILSILFSD